MSAEILTADPEMEALVELSGHDDFNSIGRTFRGEIYEEDADNPIIADFLKCHFHRPILRAARMPTTRLVGVQAANQIGKSRIGELIMKYFLKNDPGPMVLYDIGDDGSSDHMRTRFLPLLKSVPEIRAVIEGVMANDRFDVTTQDINLPGAVLRGRPLNLTTTERITVRYGLISDARMTGKEGLIRRAFIRSTQYEGIECWVVESFGGEKGDDFTEDVMRKTDEAELWVRCPRCGEGQKFSFAPRRTPEGVRMLASGGSMRAVSGEFKAVPPLDIPSLDREAWIQHWTPILTKPDRQIAGFKRGDRLEPDGMRASGGSPTRLESGALPGMAAATHGEMNEGEILKSTGYECFWCGSLLRDDVATRIALDESTFYVPTRATAKPGWRGFKIPKWINPRVSWGSCMLAFLGAMAAERDGNLLPLMEFKTKWEGETWDPVEERRQRTALEFVSGTYETDPERLMPNSHCRQCTADCSKDQDKPHGIDDALVEWLWFDVWEWDKSGNGRQLSYGVVKGWELLARQQRFWKVPNARTLIDSSWMPTQVEENAVKMFELVPHDSMKDGKPAPQVPFAWKLCAGAGQNRRLTVPGTNRGAAFSIDRLPGGPRMAYDADGKLWRMGVYKLTWSNLWFEKQLESILAGGANSKLEFLPRDKVAIIGLDGKPSPELTKWSLERCKDPLPRETGKYRSYQSQLNSRYFVEKTGKYEDYEKQSRPTEFRDTLLMQLAGLAQDGLLGHQRDAGLECSPPAARGEVY